MGATLWHKGGKMVSTKNVPGFSGQITTCMNYVIKCVPSIAPLVSAIKTALKAECDVRSPDFIFCQTSLIECCNKTWQISLHLFISILNLKIQIKEATKKRSGSSTSFPDIDIPLMNSEISPPFIVFGYGSLIFKASAPSTLSAYSPILNAFLPVAAPSRYRTR